MKQLSIDIETYSSTNLNQTGVYRYADSDDFELLLFGYAVDFGQVKVIDLTHGEKIPPQIIQALNDPTIIKSAFNAHRWSPFKACWLALFSSLGCHPWSTLIFARCWDSSWTTPPKNHCR
nr:hypothetical protein [Limosilactobacillus mucosae]